MGIFTHALALAIGFCLDLALGDPRGMPHIVVGIGKLISVFEKLLRGIFPESPAGERAAGVVLVVLVVALPTVAVALLVWAAWLLSPWLALALESFVCFQLLACKSLRAESMKVYTALEHGSLEDARGAVAMIVGRDTQDLSREEVASAAVETIAENAADGVVAPLFWMALGGPVAGVAFKAVSTMDSMVAYKNDKYLHFGWAAAKADDVLNFIPARITGALMCLLAPAAGFNGKEARRVFKRDRKNHSSPNSAHAEAACAGALGVQLGGTHTYFGKIVEKPTIGDPVRAVEAEDIPRTNKLMYASAWGSFALCLLLSLGVACLTKGLL